MITVILKCPAKSIFIIFNISEKSTRELQFKRRILEGFCVCVKSCIWKTCKVKSNHLFFILEKENLGKKCPALLKRITDTFKCLALTKKLLTDFVSVLQAEVILLKVLSCKQKVGKLQTKKARTPSSLF